MQSTHSSYDDRMESDEYNEAAVEDDNNDNYYSPTTTAQAADTNEYYPSYFRPPTRASPVPQPDWWETGSSSSGNFHNSEATPTSYPVALVFTILAMIGWHFQGPIFRWYQERIQWIFADAENVGTLRLVWDALWSALVAALDYVRATYQMAYEMLRRMLQWILCTIGFGTEYYNYEYDYDDDNGLDDNPNGAPRNNGNHNYQELRQTQRPFNYFPQRSRCNSMPGLEECDGLDTVLPNSLQNVSPNGHVRPTATKDDQENVQNKQPQQHVQRNGSTEIDSHRIATAAATDANAVTSTSFYMSQLELEPAFLHDNDYPADWLVYHPVLRVVPKAQADLYDKQQQQQRLKEKAEIVAAVDPLPQQPKPDEPFRDDDSDPASASQPLTNATTTKAALYNNLHEEEKKDDVMTSGDTEVVAKNNGWGTNGQHQEDNGQKINNDTDTTTATTVPTTMLLEMQQPGRLVNDGSQQQAPSDSSITVSAAASSESSASFRAEVVT